MHGYDRILTHKILSLLQHFPAVAILGPRQCGKTTLAHTICEQWQSPHLYLDLEDSSDLIKLDDAKSYLDPLKHTLVVIDEVQHRPGLFPEIRGIIDRGKREGITHGRFLFLGSASYELLQQSGESLAGRIAYLELTPFRLHEIGTENLNSLWMRGGFPDSFLAPNNSMSQEWRRHFTDSYLTRDLSFINNRPLPPAIRQLLTMTAHLHAQPLNIAQLVQSHEFSRPQIIHYLDLFEHSFMIRRLPPFFKNVGKRLIKRPKIYIRDSGILHHLLNITDYDHLCGHPMLGMSWEGFVIEHIINLLPNWMPHFYRTSNGAEIDLLMQNGSQLLAFEIKASSAPKVSKGFHSAKADLQPDASFVISRNNDQWQTKEGVTYSNLSRLPEILKRYHR